MSTMKARVNCWFSSPLWGIFCIEYRNTDKNRTVVKMQQRRMTDIVEGTNIRNSSKESEFPFLWIPTSVSSYLVDQERTVCGRAGRKECRTGHKGNPIVLSFVAVWCSDSHCETVKECVRQENPVQF